MALATAWAQSVRPSVASQKAEARFQAMVDSGKLRKSSRGEGLRRLETIGNSIARVARRPIPWHFYLVLDTRPNAFSPGEGVVVVTEGLLDVNLDDDELAGVVAHEVAHGVSQHLEIDEQRTDKINRQLKQLAREYADIRARQRDGPMPDDVAQSRLQLLQRQIQDLKNDQAFQSSQQRFQRQFNHEKEIEADNLGLRYAVTAGYKEEGLERALLKLLDSQVKVFGTSATGEGFTHPSTARRLEVLQKVKASYRR